MASRIQGITVEIGGDTTKLQTALKGVNSSIKSTQQQLKDVNSLLKLDPGNTELLAQKQKLLSEAVGETKEKLAALKTAAEQANTALENGEISQSQYDALQREIIETEQNLRSLETQANQSATALQKIAATGEKLQTVGDNISSAGQKMLPATAAVTSLGTAAVTTAASFESSMSQVQATMGITKEAMSTVNGERVNTMTALSNLAKEMGAKTAFSASECAEALKLNDPPKMVHRSTEVGHLIENYMMKSSDVKRYKEFLVDGLTYSDIIIKTYYDTAGNGIDIFLLNGKRFESEYQSRLYVSNIAEALNPDGTINVDMMGEAISEPFRKYMNGESISDEVRKLIEGVIL